MRKTNNLLWMGRLAVTAVVALVGFGVFAGSAQAQARSVYDFDDARAWWNAYDCAEMLVLLGPKGGTLADNNVNRDRACRPFDDLSGADRDTIEAFITDTDPKGHGSIEEWWDALDGDDRTTTVCPTAQRLVGVISILSDVTDSTETDYCMDFGDLDAEDDAGIIAAIEKAGNALSGMDPMMTDDDDDDEEAPALPLVGIGILGLLLAGRGAWLRRRA